MSEPVLEDTVCALNSDKVREIFPVAPSDRRQNADIFVHLLEKASLKSDEAFYPVLAQMISDDGIERLREYDARLGLLPCRITPPKDSSVLRVIDWSISYC